MLDIDSEPMVELVVDRSRARQSGPDIRLRVSPRSTVRDLQSSITDKLGIKADQQFLEFNEHVLTARPHEKLASFGIKDLSLIWLDDQGLLAMFFH